MHVNLIPLKTEIRNPTVNYESVCQRLKESAQYQPDIVCFPECTLTGYLSQEKDFNHFAEPIPGLTTKKFAKLAISYNILICFGMLEATDKGVFNTAVLIDRDGNIIHTHRKILEHPPFQVGNIISGIETEFGKLGVLICGDLFLDDFNEQLDNSVQFMVLPMSRSFDDQSSDLERWLSTERQAYVDAVKRAGRPIMIVNALEDIPENGSFGGAMIVSAKGDILAESEHGTDKILVYNLDEEEIGG